MVLLRSMDVYVAALPNGLDSYPECQQKASILREFFDRSDANKLADALPAPLAALLRNPPPPSEWVSEVRATAIYMAGADLLWSEAGFVDHAYKHNYALLDSTMYRILFRLVGAKRLLTQLGSNWTHFHRGSTLSLHAFDDLARTGSVEVTSPPRHVPAMLASGYATALRAAIEIAGCKGVESRAEIVSDRVVRLHVRWQ